MNKNGTKKSKKRSKKSKNNGSSGQSQKTPAVISIPHLSPCAKAYAKALADPWDEPDELPCIPDVVTIPSYKWTTKARGTFTVGTGGIGWVVASPFLCAANGFTGAGSFVDYPIISTTTGYTGPSYGWTVNLGVINTPGVVGSNPSSIVSGTQLQAGNCTMRCVGHGIRVRYTGTELNRGGRLILFRDRGNGAVSQLTNGPSLLNDPSCYTTPVSRTWRGVTYVPAQSSLLSYNAIQAFQPTSQATDTAARRGLIAYVDGSTSGNSFDYEITGYYEAVGQSMTPTTPSHGDAVGYGAILSSIPETMTSAGQSTLNALTRGALDALTKTTSGVMQFGTTMTLGAISAYLTSKQALLGPSSGPTITEI